MSTRKLSIMMLCMLSLAAFLYGCGSSSREGAASGTPDTVASVGDSMCRQCHSAVLDPLTGEGIIAQYDATSPHRNSAHANNGNGCEACHGGGAQHNGVGPIPYPNPVCEQRHPLRKLPYRQLCDQCADPIRRFKALSRDDD